MNLKSITKKQLLEMFPGNEQQLSHLIASNPIIVVFENQMLDSSELGSKSAMAIGPGCTYEKLEDIDGKWLFDLPSQRQYPVYIYETEATDED